MTTKATKKHTTKKPAQLQEVPKPLSPIMELLEQSQVLGYMDVRILSNVSELLEEMIKALVPLRLLKEAAIDYQENMDHFIVRGYLTMFLLRMDDLIFHAEGLAKKEDPKAA